jgi:hypothetical protein
VLVTFNIGDFPDTSTSCGDITVVHPDDFLLDQLDLYRRHGSGLRAQAHSCKSPEMDLEDLLGRLASAGIPKFAPRRDATCRNTMLTATKAKTRMTRHRDTRARHRLHSCLSRVRLRVVDRQAPDLFAQLSGLCGRCPWPSARRATKQAPRARTYSGQRRTGKPGPAVFLQLDAYVTGAERAYCKTVQPQRQGGETQIVRAPGHAL